MSHGYCGTIRNVDVRSVGAYTGPEPFRLAHLKNPESTKLGFESCGRGSLKRSK